MLFDGPWQQVGNLVTEEFSRKIGKTSTSGLFLTPSGTLFRNTKRFLKLIKKSKDISQESYSIILAYVQKKIMKRKLIKQDSGDKVDELDLPDGWVLVKGSYPRKFINSAHGGSLEAVDSSLSIV